MIYVPKSKRDKETEIIVGAIDLTCDKCLRKIEQLHALANEGWDATFVKFTKVGSVIHLDEVERSWPPKKVSEPHTTGNPCGTRA